MKHPAYILAGGRSSRFGTDKARAKWSDQQTVLEAVVASMDGLFSSWTVVASEAGEYADLGFRTIADKRPHQGPLGGLARAACDVADRDREGPYFFVMSCDRIGLRAPWVERLAQALVHQPRAVTFASEGRREPLFGFYHRDVIIPVQRALEHDRRAVWKLLHTIRARAIPAPDQWSQSISINTPRELRRARARFGACRHRDDS